jgi:hypothetical protein
VLVFGQCDDICDHFGGIYREVFYRYAGTSKKKGKKVIIDRCTFNKGHNVSHISRDAERLGVMLHADTSSGEAAMTDLKVKFSMHAYSLTQQYCK